MGFVVLKFHKEKSFWFMNSLKLKLRATSLHEFNIEYGLSWILALGVPGFV